MSRSVKSGSVKSGGSSSRKKATHAHALDVLDFKSPTYFMPLKMVEFYQEKFDEMKENEKEYTDLDRSEIEERLGIVHFYYGSFHKATTHLEAALKTRKKLKYNKSNARMLVLIGICQFRCKDLEGAHSNFEEVAKNSAKQHPKYAIMAYGNLALTISHEGAQHTKAAVENAKKGIDLAIKYSKGDKASPLVLSVAKILVSIYLRINEISKAENLLYSFQFPKSEVVLLQAGCKFAGGNIDDANSLLEIYLEEFTDVLKESVAPVVEEKKHERDVDTKAEGKDGGDDTKLQQDKDGSKEGKDSNHHDSESKDNAMHLSLKGMKNGGEGDAKGDAVKDDKEHDGPAPSTEAESKEATEEDLAAGAEAKARAMFTPRTLALLDLLQDDEDSDEESEEEESRPGTGQPNPNSSLHKKKKHKHHKHHSPKAKSHEELKKEAEEREYSAFVERSKQLENMLREAMMVYNLSIILTRHYKSADALKKLEKAESMIEGYMKIYSMHNKSDLDVTQVFHDAPLNFITPVDNMEESSMPLMVLNQILIAKGENLAIQADGNVKQGLDVQKGLIVNRVLPNVSNGMEGTAEGEVGKDGYVKQSKQAFQDAIDAIHKRTRLMRNQYENHSTIDKTITDEEGNETIEKETITTTISPHDVSRGEEQVALSLDKLQVMHEMPPYEAYKKQGVRAQAALKQQYGVSINERGAKSHTLGRVASTQYVAGNHDFTTMKNELLPLVGHTGRDDIALWVQWALSVTQGGGLGLLGMQFSMPQVRATAAAAAAKEKDKEKEKEEGGDDSASSRPGTNTNSKSLYGKLRSKSTLSNSDAFGSIKPGGTTYNDNFLKEVRMRLNEVEGAMSGKYDGYESLYKPGEKELRILLNCALAKVSALLKLKRDAELAVDIVEELAKDLVHRTQNYDPIYVCLAARYRLEVEEMKIPANLSPESQAEKLLELVVHAKAYLASVDAIKHITLRRDAYKKLISLYLDLAGNQGETMEGHSQGEEGSMEKLACYSKEEIQEIEDKRDVAWFRRFGKPLAQQLVMRMKLM